MFLMAQNALKFRPKTYSVFTFFLDFFTPRPLVLSVGPLGAFAKSHLALLHKNRSIYLLYLLRAVVVYRMRSYEGKITCSFFMFLAMPQSGCT